MLAERTFLRVALQVSRSYFFDLFPHLTLRIGIATSRSESGSVLAGVYAGPITLRIGIAVALSWDRGRLARIARMSSISDARNSVRRSSGGDYKIHARC